MQSKSKEIRKLAINAVINKNHTPQKPAEIADVSLSTIYSWVAIYKKTKAIKPESQKEPLQNLQKNTKKNFANLLKKKAIV